MLTKHQKTLPINSPPPEWLIQTMREAILWSDNEEPHALMAGVVWDAIKAQGFHPNGIGGTKRYSNVPVIVIRVPSRGDAAGTIAPDGDEMGSAPTRIPTSD